MQQLEPKLDPIVATAAARIRTAGGIALVLGDTPTLAAATAALALARSLEQIGKIVTVFGVADLTERLPALAAAFRQWREPLREFVISFDLSRSPIRELKYERDENRLNIILSPTGSRIRRDDVEFRSGSLRYDLVITLGIPRPAAAAASLTEVPELLLEKPIINIDAGGQNERFGDENIVGAGATPTLAELVAALLEKLDAEPKTPEDATVLFTALAAATGGFNPMGTTPNAYRLAAALCEAGANPKSAATAITLARPHAAHTLVARAIARSKIHPESGAVTAILTAEDFEKTATDPRALPFVLERIQWDIAAGKRTVLLWQHPHDRRIYTYAAAALDDPDSPPPSWHPLSDDRCLTAPESSATFREAESSCAQFLSSENPAAVE